MHAPIGRFTTVLYDGGSPVRGMYRGVGARPTVGSRPPRGWMCYFTVNVTGLLVPTEFTTVTLCGPVGAVPAIVKVRFKV